MSEECQPIFSSLLRHLVAGHLALEDEEGDAVVAALLGRSCTAQTRKSARTPLVMKVFEPLTT